MTRLTRTTTLCSFVALLLFIVTWDPSPANAACLSRRRYDSTGTLAGQVTTINVWVNNGATRGIQNTGLDVTTATEAINSAIAKFNESSVGLPRLQLQGYVANDTLLARQVGITIDGEYTDCSDPGMTEGLIGKYRSMDGVDNDDVLITMGRPQCTPNKPTWSTNLTGDNDFESTLVHEIGHALGLWHTGDSGATCPGFNYPEDMAGMTRGTMDASINAGMIGRNLWRDDIEGLRRKYNTPDVCIDDADCGATIDCNDEFECDEPNPTCSSDTTCVEIDPVLRCVDADCQVPPTKVRVHRPYFHEAEVMPTWGVKWRFPELEDIGCINTPSMSATPIDSTASPFGAGNTTDHQIVTMVDENGYVMMYPGTWGGFCEKGEYRVYPFGEGRNVYQRPVAAVSEDHGMVAWIGGEEFDSLSTTLYWHVLEFNGPCQYQWVDGGPFAVSMGQTKEPLGLGYNAASDQFVLTRVGSDAGLRVLRIATNGSSSPELVVPNFKVVQAGSPRCHNGGCVVPVRTMDHSPAWIGFNLANPGFGAVIGTDAAVAAAGYRDTVPDLGVATRGHTTHKRRAGLNAAMIGTRELRVQAVTGVAFAAPTFNPTVPPAPAPDWAGDLGSQRGPFNRYRHFHLAPDDPMVNEYFTTCVGPNCPVDCDGIPEEPVEFGECELEGILDGQGAGCPCALTEPVGFPVEEAMIPDGAYADNKYCQNAPPEESDPLVCGKAPNGYHDMCLRCNVDTMEGCDCWQEDQCQQFGEDLNCFGSLEAGWEGGSGKCWNDPPPDHICAENCTTLGRSCVYGPVVGVGVYDPAQCVDADCEGECEFSDDFCDLEEDACEENECESDADCYALGYPDPGHAVWYVCDTGACESTPTP